MLNLYNHPVKSIFVFFILTIILSVSAINIEFGENQNSKYTVYTIEFDYFGMDAAKLEEIITNPLEEQLMEIPGILEFKSNIEYSKSITTLYFSKKEDAKKNYLTIRSIVENLYNQLPKDVQKPRIYSSDAASKGIFCIAFTGDKVETELRDYLEKHLKKQLEAVKGVSEVIIAGGSQKEILVSFDPEKATGTMQNPDNFASIIQDGNFENYQSYIATGNSKTFFNFDTKIHSLKELQNLPVNLDKNIIKLNDVADIKMVQKEDEEIVLLNGEKCVSVIIKASSDGNSINISKACEKIIRNENFGNYKYEILYDLGEQQKKLINGVIIALAESFICILLIVPLFFHTKRTSFLIFLLLPVSVLWTLGVLQLLNITVNQNILAGLTIALGLIIDPVLVISEIAEQSVSKNAFQEQMKRQFLVLISAAVTTLIAFVPLFFLDNIVPGVRNIAFTITLMISLSLFIVLFFIPCFIYKENTKNKKRNISSLIDSFCNRIIYCFSIFSIRNRNIVKLVYLSFIVLPFLIIVFSGKSLTLENQSNIIYCSIDYAPEISNEYISSAIYPFVCKIKDNDCINFVKTEIHKGAVDIEIGYSNSVRKNEIAKYINSHKYYIKNGFLYVSGVNEKNSKKHIAIEIAFSGDDSLKCREYAKSVSSKLSETNIFSSVVLNFKNNESEYVFYPDRIRIANNGLEVYSLSSSLRWFMYGPVADKWIEDGKEYDIRIAGKKLNNAGLNQISNIHIPGSTGAVILSSLGNIQKSVSAGKIYHKNSRRTAYITVEADNINLDKALSFIKKELSEVKFDKGYSYSFSHELSEIRENYRLLIFALCFSIIEIFLVLIFLTENFRKGIIIISIIPASIVLPLMIKFILSSPIQLGDIIGLIILSGISVNNVIYIIESKRKSVIYKIRDKSKSIIISSLTTILSSIPLLFSASNTFCKSIAFFMVLGMLNSVVCSLFFTPSLISPSQKNS